MPEVLTTKSTVTCPHGVAITFSSSAKLRVGGDPVLVQASLAALTQTVLPAAGFHCAPQSSPAKPCTTLTPTGSASAKLKVASDFVVVNSVGACSTDGNPSTPLRVTMVQTELQAR